MFRSIRWRIAFAFTVLILLSVTGLSVYLSHFVRQNYEDNLESQLTQQAWLIGDSAGSYFAEDRTADMGDLADRLASQIDSRVTIIDQAGTVLGDSENDPTDMEDHSDRPEVAAALSGETGSSIRLSDTLGLRMMYAAVPVTFNGTVVGVARVALPMTEIEGSMSHINRAILVGALIASLGSILLAIQITRVTVNPIKKLTKSSQAMANGNLDQEIVIGSRDEVGDLAKAFNRMASRLKEMVTLVTTERDRMAVILSHMGDAIVAVDSDGRVNMLNAAAEKMLRVSADETVGQRFIEVVRDYEIDGLLQRCLGGREQQKAVVETTSRGQLLGVIVTPLEDGTGCIVLLQDLTELNKLENVRRDFVANLSHELRTPIASLKALTETLNEGALDDPAVARDFLSKMNAEVDRITQMLRELADLSSIESGRAPLKKAPVDANQVLKRVVERLRSRYEKAGIDLLVSVPEALPRVVADETRLEQVLLNLIENAIKFTPSGGHIEATARAEGSDMIFSVTDTGIGITAEDLPRIFERFYKVDKARSGQGTGLGLAIAKHIVEAHGGKIWAESVEGRGSTFIFTLPLVSL